MKKRFLSLLIAGLVTLNASAAGKKATMIMKVQVNGPSNWEFLKKTFNVQKDSEPRLTESVYRLARFTNKIVSVGKELPLGENFSYEFNYIPEGKGESEIVTNPRFLYLPIAEDDAMFKIPHFKKFSFPKDAKYVYCGTWLVTIEPKTLQFSDIRVKDEFDEAKEWFKAQYGEKKELVRAVTMDLTEDEDDFTDTL